MTDRLAQRVLVLNRLWQAVNLVSVRRALSLLAHGHARVVHGSDAGHELHDWESWVDFGLREPPPADEAIHSVRISIRVPRVILVGTYDRVPTKPVRFSRQTLFERDGHTCQYCLRPYPPRELNLDHVIPRDRGGKMTWENIVTSCIRCNTRKANRLPHEAGMLLRRRPERPRWRPFVTLATGLERDEAWTPFLHANGA